MRRKEKKKQKKKGKRKGKNSRQSYFNPIKFQS
jgi:hypothetical protein